MEIVIAAGGMPFGPSTLNVKSLGGSETAVINIAKELRKLGHLVTVFCRLPQPGSQDFIHPGHLDEDGVRWANIDQYSAFVSSTEVDLLVVSRHFELLQLNHQAKKCVLWMHDLATQAHTVPALSGLSWNFDEIWCVSEYHRKQIHEVTGYPIEFIKATRNGITPVETMDMGTVDKQLLYAARPERGLENLVRPGGIMARLPDYTLKVCMYDNFPPHMMDYYNMLWDMAKQLPNVEILGPQTQTQLRQLMRNSYAYVYPTDFEEVSCIIAREAMSVDLPFICTAKGALPETLGNCGIYVADRNVGSEEYIDAFVREVHLLETKRQFVQDIMALRDDLTWEGVALQWQDWAVPKKPNLFSQVWSLIEDSDVIPAAALLDSLEEKDAGLIYLNMMIENLYPYLFGKETFEEYYERYFKREDEKNARKSPHMEGNQRFEEIAREIGNLSPESVVLDYGCAEGVIILGLAERFKDKHFIGVDFAKSNIALCKKYAKERGLNNVKFAVGSSDAWPSGSVGHQFDAVICSEVLEHVTEPWRLADFVEKRVKVGGRVIITVPQGPWEAIGLYNKDQWPWRAHIWHINKWMIRKMFADKKDCAMSYLSCGATPDGRGIGHLVYSYNADHEGVHSIDPLEKAQLGSRFRQTVGAAIIAKNSADNIIRTLDSIHEQVQQVHIALAESTDMTEELVCAWADKHPWIQLRVIKVQDIKAGIFGFDDARNLSVSELDTDWVLWIDTDEYLSGDFRKYIRNNACDSYAIHQHHFSCDPRGTPAQLDKPARLFRRGVGFKFYGKVHEHAEKGPNGGPGFLTLLPDVDIGHTGYVNEDVRRRRFNRNFPLLEWDREVNPNRRLGHYLWLRDILHRARYAVEMNQPHEARRLAAEAVEFYRAKWEEFDAFGMGGINALAYYSEAMKLLGVGIAVGFMIQIEGADGQPVQTQFQGVFESEEEAVKLLKRALKPEFDKRKSRYWR